MRTEEEIREKLEWAGGNEDYARTQGWVLASEFHRAGREYLKWVLENS